MVEIVVAISAAIGVAVLVLLTARFILPWLACRAAARAGLNGVTRSSLRAFAALRAVAFDKHGTITTGELKVVSVDPIRPDADRDLRWFAGALEHHAEHPVGRAIAKLSARGNVKNVQEVSGYGISGSVDRHPVRVGSPSWLGVDAASEVGAVVAVEVDDRAMGTVTVADEVITEISSVMIHLRAAHITPILVTADPAVAAKDLADRAGIDQVLHGISDEARPHTEQQLSEQHGAVAAIRDEGRTIHVGDDRCQVTTGHNPLRALADVVKIARSLPGRTRTASIIAVAIGAVAGVAVVVLL